MSSQTINIGRYNGILGRMLSMGGQEDPAGALSPEISPVLVLENDRPEWLFLGNVRLHGAAIALAAGGAGNFATARLRNPATSGALVVVTSIQISVTTISEVKIFLATSAVVDATTPQTMMFPHDSRWGAQTSGAAKGSSKNDNTASQGTVIWDHFLAVNTPIRAACCPLVLAPDSSIDVVNAQGNQGIFVQFSYTERAMQPFENP